MTTRQERGPGERDASFDTRAIHAGNDVNETSALTPPIFQSSTFKLDSAAHGRELASATAPADFYTRWGNPTTKQAEAVIADLEGAEAAMLFSSGMGAISSVLISLLSSGDHVLVGRSIYSGTYELTQGIFRRFGIESSCVDTADSEALAGVIRPNTRALIFETPTNPTLEICDLDEVAAICRDHDVLTIVDNTFATPYNQNPLAHGVDIVVHAATKGLGGHSDLTAGVVCSTRELVDGCWPMLKLFGACLSPFESWLLLRGMKTLPVRLQRQNETSLALARFLAAQPGVEKVWHPGLESHPGHELAKKQMRGFGSMVSFELAGGREAGVRFAESLEIIQLAVSLGGAESILSHPASMSHQSLDEETLQKAGLSSGLLRLSVGLEAVEDLERDLARALAT